MHFPKKKGGVGCTAPALKIARFFNRATAQYPHSPLGSNELAARAESIRRWAMRIRVDRDGDRGSLRRTVGSIRISLAKRVARGALGLKLGDAPVGNRVPVGNRADGRDDVIDRRRALRSSCHRGQRLGTCSETV